MSEQHEGEQPVERPIDESVTQPGFSPSSVLKLIDDWEQDYFTPVSFPPHTKAHIDHAMANLKERIKGLVS